MSCDRASEVSGPVAMITGPPASAAAGMAVTSSRSTSMSGCAPMAAVTAAANRPRSTASAAPAGTRVASAQRMMIEPRRRISSFSTPTALSSLSPRKLLEQTSSARLSLWCTSVGRTGRISWRRTRTPREAACHAASHPARPPPMMVTTGGVTGFTPIAWPGASGRPGRPCGRRPSQVRALGPSSWVPLPEPSAGRRPPRASRHRRATSLGTDALVVPSVTYGPYRPSRISIFACDAGCRPTSRSTVREAVRRRPFFSCLKSSTA